MRSNSNVKRLDILKEKWDTLIILDACRYDMFKEIAYPILKGKLEKRWSTAFNTPRWIRYQFKGDPYVCHTCITGNSNYALQNKNYCSEIISISELINMKISVIKAQLNPKRIGILSSVESQRNIWYSTSKKGVGLHERLGPLRQKGQAVAYFNLLGRQTLSILAESPNP